MAITLVIAEDDPLLRGFLNERLSGQDDLKILEMVGSGREALEAVTRLKPGVLLLDLNLPQLSGLEVLERLVSIEPRPRVLVLSGDERAEMQISAARQGAQGFLCKSQAIPVLPDAIRTIAGGGVWFTRQIIGQIFQEYPVLVRKLKDQNSPLSQLSERETEVLVRVARGMTNQQIAGDLFMSISTVKAHIRNIFQKLNLPNRTEAAVFAVREGLLESPAGQQ